MGWFVNKDIILDVDNFTLLTRVVAFQSNVVEPLFIFLSFYMTLKIKKRYLTSKQKSNKQKTSFAVKNNNKCFYSL